MCAWPRQARSQGERAEAAENFDRGAKAFARGDFRRAAEAFEAAYRLGPRPDVLWNAAQAWQRAGEAARAATLYARYLREAPPAAPDRGAATAQLAALSPRLARVEVHGDNLEQLAVDDVPSQETIVYVSRGAHVVSAVVGGRPVRKTQAVEAGDVVSVVLETPAVVEIIPAPPSSLPAARVSLSPEPPPRPAHTGWSPWVFVGSASLAAAAVGLTIGSGIDTDASLKTFDAHGTPANLRTGQEKELRTNILLGTSVALGLLTAATALWLVDWHGGGQRVSIGLGPARLGVRWSF
jgi:tetratricopeptide (TPR) repeat protein